MRMSAYSWGNKENLLVKKVDNFLKNFIQQKFYTTKSNTFFNFMWILGLRQPAFQQPGPFFLLINWLLFLIIKIIDGKVRKIHTVGINLWFNFRALFLIKENVSLIKTSPASVCHMPLIELTENTKLTRLITGLS